jgi:hypothetical protein
MDGVGHPKPLSVLPCTLLWPRPGVDLGPISGGLAPALYLFFWPHELDFPFQTILKPPTGDSSGAAKETRRAHLWSHTLWLGYSAERHSLCAGQLSYGRCLCFNTGEHLMVECQRFN